MDIKAKVDEIVNKVKKDPALLKKFTSDPAGAIKELTGLDIPKEQLDSVVSAVKAKLGADALGGALGGLFGKK